MLLRTNAMRFRTRVSAINDKGQLEFFIHPRVAGSVAMNADHTTVSDNLDYSALKVGDSFDALVVRYPEIVGRDDNGNATYKKDSAGEVIFKYVAVGIENLEIHPFDIQALYPEGLPCLTATVNQSFGGHVFATAKVNGEEKVFSITEGTGMFQAQQGGAAADKIRLGLKFGDAVILRYKPEVNKPANQPAEVIPALYASVVYR